MMRVQEAYLLKFCIHKPRPILERLAGNKVPATGLSMHPSKSTCGYSTPLLVSVDVAHRRS